MSLTQDWRFRNECSPFQDEENYYIAVDSEYESPSDDKDRRLAEVQRDGVFKLLKFYGKDTGVLDEIFRVSKLEDYFVSYRPCVKMKALVSIPRADFDLVIDDPAGCEINRPEEGYLSAFLPVSNLSSLVESVASGMSALTPFLYRSDKFISNVNIPREINRLRAAGRAIQRYIDLNQIPSVKVEDPECVQPNEVDRILEIGFSFDYKAVFAIVDKEQYTIGYDCLLENINLNHDTTINYLSNLQEMFNELQLRNLASFDTFSFFSKYTIPAPVIETKQNALDGLEKYEQNGQLNVFANLAKLITLDLDVNLCKTAEEKAAEDRVLINQETLNAIDQARKQTKDAVGNDTLSKGGRERLKQRLDDVGALSGDEALNILYEDIMAKVDFACVLEESIQCVLENMITRFGQEVFDDPDLEKVFRVQNVSLGGLNNNCALNTQEKCDGSPDIGLKVGFPVFQGVRIPETLPLSLDFLADTIDIALQNLYNRLVNSLATTIIGILEGICELVLSFPDGLAGIPGQFESWLSDTLGIDLQDLRDRNALVSALTSNAGTGFVGIIGKAASRVTDGLIEVYTEAGVAINFPNEDGQVEEVFISPEFVLNYISGVASAIQDVEAVLTPTETQSLFKGVARPEVLKLAYKCATRASTELFPTQQDFEDAMFEFGSILNPEFLTQDLENLTTVASTYCELGDTTSSNKLRESLLFDKGENISIQEIDEIIEKEKQRGKTRLLESLDTLEEFRAGNLAPSFPNIFGEGGLIPETPPVIDEITQLVAETSLQSVVSTFSVDSLNYSDYWGNLKTDNPFGIYNNSVTSEQSDIYKIGYSLTTQPQNVIQEEDFTVILTDQGDEVVTYDFGINFGSRDKDKLEEELQKAYSSTFGTTGPYITLYQNNIAEFIEDKDTGFGTEPVTKRFDDPEDPTIYYAVTVDESNGTVEIQQRQGPGVQTTDIVRETGFENEIIKLSLAAQATKTVTQKSDDFTIGNTAGTLGTKFSTGRLRTDIFTTGFGDLQIQQNVEILTPEAQAFGEDLDITTLNQTLINQFIAYIPEQENTETDLDLTYPASDILGYAQLLQFAKEFSSQVLTATLNGEICDTLSSTRRANATTGLRMLVRNFIIEQALISIQVFNSFDISFMESDLFISSVYETLAAEMSEYQSSFDTLESSLLSELKQVALKYYEILKVLGQDDREPQSGKLAIKEVIGDEVKILKQPIINALGLQFNTNTWDDFLIDNVFGEISDVTQTLQKDTISSVAPEEPGFVFLRSKTENKPTTTYSYDLLIATATEEEQVDGRVTDGGSDYNIRSTEGGSITVETETVISIQCEQEDESEADENEIYSNLRAMMIETENYKKLFYDLIPVDSLVATLSLYQYSALSDPAVYPNNDDLYDLMGKTKLSTLQIFAAAIYGGGKISYQDPFLEKAGTDQVF